MNGDRAERIETLVDASAAALLAAASAYALAHFTPTAAAGAAAGVVAFWVAFKALRRVRADHPGFVLADFRVGEVTAEEVDELVLTDADRLIASTSDELALEDELPQPAPDSRVVRLFDASAMPTPGQLQARIDGHLSEAGPPIAPPDASQALQQALADLRRSLR
jgi:hypothetical protein